MVFVVDGLVLVIMCVAVEVLDFYSPHRFNKNYIYSIQVLPSVLSLILFGLSNLFVAHTVTLTMLIMFYKYLKKYIRFQKLLYAFQNFYTHLKICSWQLQLRMCERDGKKQLFHFI